MKFKLNQTVSYMHEDRIESGMIQSQITVQHSDDDMLDLELISNSSQLFVRKNRVKVTSSGYYYITRHGLRGEDALFATKEELIDSL